MDDDVTTPRETTPRQTTPRLGVLGGGVMGETVVAAALRAGWSDEDVRVTERSAVRANELSERYGVRAADGNAKVARWADVVLVALKPYDVADVLAERTGRAKGSYEYQMLYGIRPDEQLRLAGEGQTVRVYIPYGQEWYGYLMRRLAERPANVTFFLRAMASRR